jgi:hypothetical protein
VINYQFFFFTRAYLHCESMKRNILLNMCVSKQSLFILRQILNSFFAFTDILEDPMILNDTGLYVRIFRHAYIPEITVSK